jgi:hypothetical protein
MLWMIDFSSLPVSVFGSADLWAYVGLGPGQEFIPQFLAMMGLVATALLAVVQWPLLALWSRLSRAFAARKNGQSNSVQAAQQPEQNHLDNQSEPRP